MFCHALVSRISSANKKYKQNISLNGLNQPAIFLCSHLFCCRFQSIFMNWKSIFQNMSCCCCCCRSNALQCSIALFSTIWEYQNAHTHETCSCDASTFSNGLDGYIHILQFHFNMSCTCATTACFHNLC